jgi:hypothetical protein
VALFACAIGCSLDETGLGSFDAATDAPVVVDATADVADASPADGATDVVSEQPACAPDTCQGERCTAEACDYYASCAEMHAADATRTTGLHHFKGGNGPFDAWCDMDTDNGGWTLVGRGVTLQSSTNFGWFRSSGTPATDRVTPYSLNAPANGLTFSHALVGDVDQAAPDANTWGADVNRVDLPSGFPGNFQSSAGGALVTVITTNASCSGSQITMLSVAGYTGHGSQFYFRDNLSDGPYGLFPDGFHLNYGDCRSGTMDGRPGMVMVK